MTTNTPEHTPGPYDQELRARLLGFEDILATGRPVTITMPEAPTQDEHGNPTGVGVVDLPVDVFAGMHIDAAMLARAGLTDADVPHLTVHAE